MSYTVKRAPDPAKIELAWDGEFWRDAEPLELKHFMGTRPEHFPRVRAKLAYSPTDLFVIFAVDDQYVRAVARNHQGSVFRDSCVEFFFTPGPDVSQGYVNLEMNCGGTMLLHYQRRPRRNSAPFTEAEIDQIEVLHQLPKIVDPEISEPLQWAVAYRLPIKILEQKFPGEIDQPAPGVTWRANLYKCGDDTSHPHWLTWAPVEGRRPNFHQPDQFGTLVFE